jgi:hypothetical protein
MIKFIYAFDKYFKKNQNTVRFPFKAKFIRIYSKN